MILAERRRLAARLLAGVAWLVLALCPATVLAQTHEAAIPALASPVVDATGTLDAAHRQQLVQQALDLQKRKGSQLQILIVASTRPETIEQYTQRVYDQWRLGRKGVDDGVLLVVARDDHRVRIQPGYGLEGAIPDAIANRVIQQYLVPYFRHGDYAGGITAATAVLVKLIDGEALPAPAGGHDGHDRSPDWLFALFAAFIAASVARGLFGRAPKPLRSLLTGGAAGAVAWLFSALLPVAGIAAVLGLGYGLLGVAPGGFVNRGGWGGWGGGGFGGGGFGGGGSGGGGWGGGGGMSGGGGASGSW